MTNRKSFRQIGAAAVLAALILAFAPGSLASRLNAAINYPTPDPCPGPNTIVLVRGANGHVYCASDQSLVAAARATDSIPVEITAIFGWNNVGQKFNFWFRGFPANFQTLTDVFAGSFYFFQASGAGQMTNTGGFATLAIPGTTSLGPTITGANATIWAGTNHALATLNGYASITGVTAMFSWNNSQQRFDFWFRGFPDGFQTLTGGIERARHYFLQSPEGLIVLMD